MLNYEINQKLIKHNSYDLLLHALTHSIQFKTIISVLIDEFGYDLNKKMYEKKIKKFLLNF